MKAFLPLVAVAATVALTTGASAQTPPPAPAKGPSAALALEAAQTALATCTANGFKVSVAVIDAAGVQKVLLASDGAPAMGVTMSLKKAQTSVIFKNSTAAVNEAVKTDAAMADKVKAESLVTWAGGQPLMAHGELIGAIGVGGAPGGDKDDVCANAAVAKIKDRL